ncbi:orotidine-5'-phosphate decarboxylase [Saccharophagus degradans]|uniref:orotidine-5'-phosphate decarboxylase n=1 Tax=Saccharophagus degradans TaxID=86304 RepID=UPI001C08A8B9|nr:orotidine-5'-phosphate decarboxylase [Saccharophagus degradans]MBU2985801.1 orotidine-5'-phosphate decarboxylase [Saccharophagus degradans]
MNIPDPQLVIALDFDTQESCLELVDQLDPTLCRLKIGKELFTSCGPKIVEKIQWKGFDVFLDLKFHDIPNTVAKAVKAAAELGVWMVNVHASGGEKMMLAAREALEGYQVKPLLIAVTVLTSMSDEDLKALGITVSAAEQVQRLAALAKQAQMDGVVCSAQEVVQLKASLGEEFKMITPGIRPSFAGNDDQTRIMTPEQALKAGSDYLVVGRPVTQADDPLRALEQIAAEMARASLGS